MGSSAPGPNQWPSNAHPDHLKEVCEGSLRRLRIDEIPLYQLHRPDPQVPYEDSVGALVELKAQGKIRHIGLSNVNEAELRRAQSLTPVVSVQNRYNHRDRNSESMLDLCEQEGIAFLPYSPIQQTDANVLEEIAATPRRHRAAGGPRLAARPLPGDAADPGHRLGRPPRGERRRRQPPAHGRRDRRTVRRRVRRIR